MTPSVSFHYRASSYYRQGIDKFRHFLEISSDIAQDLDACQRVGLIFISIVQGHNWYYNKNYLGNWVAKLDVLNVNDFFDIFQLPYRILYPVTIDRLNEQQLLEEVVKALKTSWNVQNNFQEAEQELIQKNLSAFLEEMHNQNKAYRNTEELKLALKDWLTEDPQLEKMPYASSTINLDGLQVILKEFTLVRILSIIMVNVCDVLCVAFYLGSWNTIDLPSLALSFGQYPLLGWVATATLSTWVARTYCLSLFLQAVQAIRTHWNEGSYPSRIARIRWDVSIIGTELISNCVNLVKGLPVPLYIFFNLVAKSTGLIGCIYKPDPIFFEKA